MTREELDYILTTETLTDEEVVHLALESEDELVLRLVNIIDNLRAECYALSKTNH